MATVSYKAMSKNTKLTQFPGFREMVLANSIQKTAQKVKKSDEETNMVLDFY